MAAPIDNGQEGMEYEEEKPKQYVPPENPNYNPDNPTGIYDPSSIVNSMNSNKHYWSDSSNFSSELDTTKKAGLRGNITDSTDNLGNPLPATAYEYIMQRIDAAKKNGPIDKWKLRSIENGAKAYYNLDKNFDISGQGIWNSDRWMAESLNRGGSGSSTTKQQEPVTTAKDESKSQTPTTDTAAQTPVATTKTSTPTTTTITTTNNTSSNTTPTSTPARIEQVDTGGRGAYGGGDESPDTSNMAQTVKSAGEAMTSHGTNDKPVTQTFGIGSQKTYYVNGKQVSKDNYDRVKNGTSDYLKDQASLSSMAVRSEAPDQNVQRVENKKVLTGVSEPVKPQATTGTVGDKKRQQAVEQGQERQRVDQTKATILQAVKNVAKSTSPSNNDLKYAAFFSDNMLKKAGMPQAKIDMVRNYRNSNKIPVMYK